MLSVLRKSMRDSRRTVFWLCFGFALYSLFIMSFYPSILDQSEELESLMNSYPPEMMNMFMAGIDIEEFDFTDPAQYLQAEYMTWVMLILGTMFTAQAFNGILNAERDGTMDLLLSLPVTRRQIILARMGNTVVSTLIVLTTVFLALAFVQSLYDEFEIPLDQLAQGIYGVFFLLMTQASLTYMLGSLSPSRQHWAGPAALTYFFMAYILTGFASTVEWIDTFSPLYLFKYYNTVDFINNGVNWGNTLVLIGASLLFSGVAIWRFERKEIAV